MVVGKKIAKIPIIGLIVTGIIIINNLLGWQLDKLAKNMIFR